MNKKKTLLTITLFLSAIAAGAQRLIVESFGEAPFSFFVLNNLRCVNFIDKTNIRLVGRYGALLRDGLAYTDIKLRFVEDSGQQQGKNPLENDDPLENDGPLHSDGQLTIECIDYEPVEYDLADLLRIDVTNPLDVRLIGMDGSALLAGLSSDNLKLNFTASGTPTNTVGASVAEAGGIRLSVRDQKIVISGAGSESSAAVYKADGTQIAGVSLSGEETVIEFGDVPCGIYIVCVGRQSFKVTKR